MRDGGDLLQSLLEMKCPAMLGIDGNTLCKWRCGISKSLPELLLLPRHKALHKADEVVEVEIVEVRHLRNIGLCASALRAITYASCHLQP